MTTSKQFLVDYLLKSPASGKSYHLVGSSLEVVMDKFNILAAPNCWLCLSSTRQSEQFYSSSQHPNKSSAHKEIVEFCNSWCGSYYIRVRNWLSCIQMAQCKITPNSAKRCWEPHAIIRDYVQCQSRDWETWDTCFNIQSAQEKISFTPQWAIWILVLPWRHQTLRDPK